MQSRLRSRAGRPGHRDSPDGPKDIDRIFREDLQRIDEALEQGVREAMIRHEKDARRDLAA